MAMLAESRKKSKYRLMPSMGFSKINKRCDEDTSSVGYKLMASMGWAPGKGLGANETGGVDPIKLRLKNDAAGVGFKISEHDAVSQQTEFQALLLQLNSGPTNREEKPSNDSGKSSIKSLEKMSEQSSRRVHYKKFTRGKDLSRASDKDLRSILGLSSADAPVRVVEPEPELPKPEEETTVQQESNMYISGGSSADYFKNKFADSKKKRKREHKADKEDETTKSDVSDSNGNKRRSVTWGEVDVSYVEKYIKDMMDTSGSMDESAKNSFGVEEPSIKKQKKKKRRMMDQVATEDHEDAVEQVEMFPVPCKEKKKRNKDKCEESSKENINDIEDVDHSVRKKKKKQKICEAQQEEECDIVKNGETLYNEDTPIAFTEPPAKLKKKKKKKKDLTES